MRICKICGKKAIRGMDVSYSHKRNHRARFPNLQRGGICTRCLKRLKKIESNVRATEERRKAAVNQPLAGQAVSGP